MIYMKNHEIVDKMLRVIENAYFFSRTINKRNYEIYERENEEFKDNYSTVNQGSSGCATYLTDKKVMFKDFII